MVILLSLGLAFMQMTQSEANIVMLQEQQLKAFYSAEAGIEQGFAELKNNMDTGGDGIGNALNIDFDGDGQSDYDVTYNTKVLTSLGHTGSATRTVQARINDSGFPSAVLGYRVEFSGGASATSGTINGDFQTGDGDPAHLSNVQLIGRNKSCTPFCDNRMDIPVADFQYYADQTPADHKYGNTGGAPYPPTFPPSSIPTTVTWTSDIVDDPSAIHYINGNLQTCHMASNPVINIDGTVVVTGDLILGAPPSATADRGLIITPAPGKPALVVQGRIRMYFGSLGTNFDLGFYGLVYVYGNMYISNFRNLLIKGALVERGASGVWTSIRVGNVNITYDPDINPGSGFFTGGKIGVPAIVSWQGHGA